MFNLFEAIIGVCPIFCDNEVTLYPGPQPRLLPRQQLTDGLATELEGLGLFQVMLKTPGIPLSDLAMRTYGLGPYTESKE